MRNAPPSHADQLGKLNRVSGQIEGIKRMITDEAYCVDIITQLKAARSALKAIELAVLETHMKTCLREAARRGTAVQNRKVEEITNLLRKYE